MLESQRKKARLKGRLVARGMSEEEARKEASRHLNAFRPAFVKGRHRSKLAEKRTASEAGQSAKSAERNAA